VLHAPLETFTDEMTTPPNKENLWAFRMVHYRNLPHILEHGMYCRRSIKAYNDYVNIGSTEIIGRRDTVTVKSDPACVVNDYVPFYFGVRSPMLYKIHTGYGVPQQPQEDIIYLCCRFVELVGSDLEWCFTDGNAATGITTFFTEEEEYSALDWTSIYATEWHDNNKDGDHDRMRKKHAEFLVKGQVPPSFIRRIVVKTEEKQRLVEKWVAGTQLDISVYCNRPQFYF
jgi:hypothetical protein